MDVTASGARCQRVSFRFLAFVLSGLFLGSAHAGSIDDARAFLLSQQRADGAVSGSADIATAQQATAEALIALDSSGASHDAGIAFLANTPFAEQPTRYLARFMVASGSVNASAQAELLSRQNADGGFGVFAGASSNVIDTAFALRALAESSDIAAIDAAATWLGNAQLDNGAWPGPDGQPSRVSTARVTGALAKHRHQLAAETMVARAVTFLLGTGTGMAAEPHETALVLSRIAPIVDTAILDESLGELQALQQANGSWGNDVYVTALAVQAVRAREARRSGESARAGSVTGQVVHAGTGVPVSGASVFLADFPELAVSTDGDGRYRLQAVPAAKRTLVATAPGLTSAAVVATVEAGSLATAPPLVLDIATTTVILTGEVKSARDGMPIASATFNLQGPTSVTAKADDSGAVRFPGLQPGSYELEVSAGGFRPESVQLSLAPGDVLHAPQLLAPADAYAGTEPVSLSLQAVNGVTGEPIAGAVFTSGSMNAIADATGHMRLDALAPGDYRGELSALGYASRSLGFSLPATAQGVSLGEVALYPVTAVAAPTTVSLALAVTDSVNGKPVAGALVQFAGGASFTTDTSGQILVSELATTDLQLSVSAEGYLTTSRQLALPAFGSHALVLPLAPKGDPARVSSAVSGIVTNQATGSPVAGAIVTLNGGEKAVTDESGGYRFEAVTFLEFELSVDALGFHSVTQSPRLEMHGDYTVDVELPPVQSATSLAFTAFNVDSVADGTMTGTIVLSNLADEPHQVALSAEAFGMDESAVGTLTFFDPADGTNIHGATLLPRSSHAVSWRWHMGHAAPGAYRQQFHATEPGTTSEELPRGRALAKYTGYAVVGARRAISGSLLASPPVVQGGTTVPVELDAVVVNEGNTSLDGEQFRITVRQEGAATPEIERVRIVDTFAAGAYRTVDFGDWLPAATGNYLVDISPVNPGVSGAIDGTVYVGDRPAVTFEAEPSAVLPGDQLVRASLMLRGLDLRQGSSSDPLTVAAHAAVRRGIDYLMPATRDWAGRSRCLGCHIQH
ncbi:MAG TPA: carboxypeptidase regulatory-like domain-containing protein [Gammaproteobacteria bacterium]